MAIRDAHAPMSRPLRLLLLGAIFLTTLRTAWSNHIEKVLKDDMDVDHILDHGNSKKQFYSQPIDSENSDNRNLHYANSRPKRSTDKQQPSACSTQCLLCPECPSSCPSPHLSCPTCRKAIPPGYEHFPRLGFYRFHTVPQTWMEAKATCEREGAHLAIINSQEEANLMIQFFFRDLEIGTWIHLGFHDLYKEGKYVTIFGTPLSKTGYTTWNPNQPDNNNNNENCGSMYASGGLNDLECHFKQAFVCELPV